MKIIHCADLHLDSPMTGVFMRERDQHKARQRRNELLVTYLRLLKFAQRNNVEHIMLSGDIFDTNIVTDSVRAAVENSILSNPHITFYYLKGNHDRDSFLDKLKTPPPNLKLFEKNWTYHLIPDSKIVIAGKELSESSDANKKLKLESENFNIVMLHGQESENKELLHAISFTGLRGKNIDYLALGHIHIYTRAVLDERGIYCYPGCLEGRGFDECGRHGFVLLNVNEKDGSFTDEFIPIAGRTLHQLQVEVSNCKNIADLENLLRYELNKAGVAEDDLCKITLKGETDPELIMDTDCLEALLEENIYLVLIKDDTCCQPDIASYIAEPTLRGEFVRMTHARTDLTAEQKARIITYGLRAIAGKDILL